MVAIQRHSRYLPPMTDVAPESPAADGNAAPYSVSELAFALKRTLEDAYGFVRLRGEISKTTHHTNGHVYLDAEGRARRDRRRGLERAASARFGHPPRDRAWR